MKRNLILFLNDITDNIKNIESFSFGLSKERFRSDILRQNAIMRCLEVIGEATKNIPNSFRTKYPEIPWKKIAGFRDVLIHEYFGVKIDRVWNVIKKDLPDLKKKIIDIRRKMEGKVGDETSNNN